MKRLTALLLSAGIPTILMASAAPVFAQRADENAVESADDAFGTSVGNEKIGLYNAGDVRGLSPISAGNIRIEGLSVTEHGGFTQRIVSGSTIRVGLTAQSYPFPAPTGIADYSLRNSGNEAIFSPVLYFGPNGSYGLDADAQVPLVRDRLSIAAGVSYRYDENFPGEDAKNLQAGAVARWRPDDGIEIKAFYGRTAILEDRDLAAIFTGGAYLPPKVERRLPRNGVVSRSAGVRAETVPSSGFTLLADDAQQDWLYGEARRESYGAVGSVRLTDGWQIRGGLFRWENAQPRTRTELLRNVQPDGSAQRTIVAQQDQLAASTSGELRSTHSVVEGPRRHTVHLAARGRNTSRNYGGGDIRDLGSTFIGTPVSVPEPDFSFGPRARDDVRQLTGAIGYEGQWRGVGEVSLALQRTDYRKRTVVPGGAALTSAESLWLYNGTLALHLTDDLVAYAGYTRGLEESGTAPANATNRNAAPPALETSQRDGGLRYAIGPRLTFVAGFFDVRKPYFNVGSDRVFRQLGTVRHRGVELSLAGQPAEGLSVVAGAVLLDARVTGEAADLGSIGDRPVGTTGRVVRANLDYRLPFLRGVSVDLGIANQAGQVASVLDYAELGGRQLMTRPQTIVDLGARYRFRAAGAPVTLRAQVTNLFDTFRWKVSPNASFRFIDARRLLMTLAADL